MWTRAGWLIAFLCATQVAVGTEQWEGKIEHVVVLMMENRAFDHLLGNLHLQNEDIDGCVPGGRR